MVTCILLSYMVVGFVEAAISCRTDSSGYTYCVDSKTGKPFIIKPQPGGGVVRT